MASNKPDRLLATLVLKQVLAHGRSLTDVLNNDLAKKSNNKAFIKEISFGTLRYYGELLFYLNNLLQKPIKEKYTDIKILLLIGIYQLKFMRLPSYAVINETVETTILLKKNWAKNLVNAVLRQFLKQEPLLKKNLKTNEEALFSHPTWLINKIKEDWPKDWQNILLANNTKPPMSLRLNINKLSREAFIKTTTNSLSAHDGYGKFEVILDNPVPINQLPEFNQGTISVQDGGAQLAASLIDLFPEANVLDACAAPGGKTCHLLEYCEEINLTAVDISPQRTKRIEENLIRLNLQAKINTADLTQLKSWWEGDLFDRILLDAPCSASGVIRRHPDIKWLKQITDIKKLTTLQAKLLDILWPTLKPGGILLYITCSIFREENDKQIMSFLERNNDARHKYLGTNWGIELEVGQQILPGMNNWDGFYYAKLVKNNS